MSFGHSEAFENHILASIQQREEERERARVEEKNKEFDQLIADTAPDELMGRDVDPEVTANRMRLLVEVGAEALASTGTAQIPIVKEPVDANEFPNY